MQRKIVIAALERQVELYRQLVQLSAKQRFHLHRGHTRKLLEVLKQRQGAVDEIEGLDVKIRPLMKSWKHFFKSLDRDDRIHVQGQIASAEELLARISQSDRM